MGGRGVERGVEGRWEAWGEGGTRELGQLSKKNLLCCSQISKKVGIKFDNDVWAEFLKRNKLCNLSCPNYTSRVSKKQVGGGDGRRTAKGAGET